MKQLLIIATLLFISQFSFADCASSGLYFWPKGKSIKQNSIIMMEGFAVDQSLVKGLNTTYRVYLESNNHKVSLTIIDTLTSEYYLTQALLKPTDELKIGQVYKLVIYEAEVKGSKFSKWKAIDKPRGDVKWTVESGKDENPPKFTSIPKETDNLVEYFGCGPSIHVVFDYDIDETSEYLIKTTVRSVNSDKIAVYYLIPQESRVYVGHSMCSGAFVLKEGNQYEANFELLDASGNISSAGSDRIKFTVDTN